MHSVALIVAAIAFAAPAFAGDDSGPSQVAFHQHGHGWLLTDDKGMTLYTYDKDIDPGKSKCVAACAKQWPPLLVTADTDRVGEDWSIITRDDGGKQWAYLGRPLYLYSGDSAVGQANGDGSGNQWRQGYKPIPTPPGIGIQATLIGYVLTDLKGLTLYSFNNDKPDGSGCDAACTGKWMPMLAPTVAHSVADWTIRTRKDGTRQWAFKDKPVYRYAGDVHVGETAGEKIQTGWHAVVLEPLPPNPAWITLQESDEGELLADARGRTLYTFDPAARPLPGGGVIVPQFDEPEDWSPLQASDKDKPIGNWTVVDRDGQKQWAYKGMPLYTNNRDKIPGDLFGLRGGGRARLRPILRSSLIGAQGTGA